MFRIAINTRHLAVTTALCLATPVLFFSVSLSSRALEPDDKGQANQGSAAQQEKLLVDENFSNAEALSSQWNATTGDWQVVDGVLRAKEIEAQQHSAAARRIVATDDAIYQLRFRFVNSGEALHFGFDPAPGQLKKRGHLFSIVVTPTQWQILKHIDKNRPQEQPNEILAERKSSIEIGKWYQLRVVTQGKQVTATIEGQESLQVSHDTFEVKKPTLVFRCFGDGVEIDDLKVWANASSGPLGAVQPSKPTPRAADDFPESAFVQEESDRRPGPVMDSATIRAGLQSHDRALYIKSGWITGPYGPRQFAGRFLGHGTPFQTKDGKWWCTAFFNGNVPPVSREGIETRDLGDNAQTINEQGVTIVPLDVRIQEEGQVYIRAKDPAYATPGPDEAQEFTHDA